MKISALSYSATKITFLLIPFLSAGCLSQKIVNTGDLDAASARQAANTTQTPQQVCETASMAVSTANKEELYFFAPLHLEQASDALDDGLDQIKNKETQAEGVKKCFKVGKLIEDGLTIKTRVKASLSDSLAELAMLKKVDIEKRFSEDIQDSADDIVNLVKKIEAGKMNEAMQDQSELLKDMIDLEINIVTYNNLNPVEVMIEKADDINADNLAEKTFDKAVVELESAKKFIQSNYRDNDGVKKTSALAMRAAKHAFYIAQEVETLQELDSEKAEEKVLYFESLLERINKMFNNDVVIGNSLYEQSNIITGRLSNLIDNHESAVKEVALFKQQNKTQGHIQTEALNESQNEIQKEVLNESQPEIQNEIINETQNAIQSEAINESQSEIQSEAINESQSAIQTEAVNETQSAIQSEVINETQSAIQTEVINESQSAIQSDTINESQSEIQNEVINDSQSEIKSNIINESQNKI